VVLAGNVEPVHGGVAANGAKRPYAQAL